MDIRRLKEEDAKAVAELIVKTIRISNTKDYPAELMEELEGLSKSKAAVREELTKLFTEEYVLTENAKEPEKGREKQ